ncbi:MAG TPA: class I SAM-dependent methyltransferase [Pyrinomonadaceae bacterium]|jgi:ubiquinone/menaquinone biosynthesis C-methylase UbiE|nr:class I SAM-dependent methyltransferase [Pyrinomonadaceae bacterium]
MEERLRLEFNDWARAGRCESMERAHRPTGEQAIARMNVGKGSRVLDLGCGSGWATRLLAGQAVDGIVIGIDISDEMIERARKLSADYGNVEFRLASAERLPFEDDYFSHAFSMESLYYYADIAAALREVHRVLEPGGLFVTVVDLYEENEPSHQWIEQLNVPISFLSIAQYRALFEEAGFSNVLDERLIDPTPVPEGYTGGSFKTRDDYLLYKESGSLMLSGRR